MRYVSLGSGSPSGGPPAEVLAISTENGRIQFYRSDSPAAAPKDEAAPTRPAVEIPLAQPAGEIQNPRTGTARRIKDFVILDVGSEPALVVAAGSDGAIQLWSLDQSELLRSSPADADENENVNGMSKVSAVGQLLGTYETGNRITCLGAFILQSGAATISNESDTSEDDTRESDSDGASGNSASEEVELVPEELSDDESDEEAEEDEEFAGFSSDEATGS